MFGTDEFRFSTSPHLEGVTLLRATMRDFRYKRHAHDEYAIGVTLRGHQHFYCDGAYYRSEPGGVVQINPDELHDGFAEDANGFTYDILYIPPPLMHAVLQSYAARDAASFRFADTLVDSPALGARLRSLTRAFRSRQTNAMHLEQLFIDLAGRLLERGGALEPADRPAGRDPAMRRARDYIRDNLCHEMRLDEISALLGVSKYRFVRRFKEQFRTTPYHYALSCRINAARRDLERGDAPFDVMVRYGFYDMSHFNRRFKEVYGTTPHAFRRHVLA